MPDDWWNDGTRRQRAELIDTTTPSVARIADYLGGGRDNFEADRKAVRGMIGVAPIVATLVPSARAFHHRVVRYLVAEAGIRQFLDFGAGLATSGRTNELAQAIDPKCSIVYADDDPMVLTHLRALSKSTPEGAIDFVDGHLREPGTIVAGARATLDFGEPVAVLLLSSSTLGVIADIKKAAAAVSTLVAAVPSGSYVALYHQASDLHPELHLANRRWNQASSQPVTLRSKDEVASFVADLELVPPGLVPICDWHPAPDDPRFGEVVPIYGVVARKP
jgi:S-adenosyl methyltransferase